MPLRGIPAAPGIAIGTALILREDVDLANIEFRDGPFDADDETRKLKNAIDGAANELAELVENCRGEQDSTRKDILNSHCCIVRDPEISDEAIRIISSEGVSAEEGIARAIRDTAAIFADIDDDPYLKERANDIEDVGRRILRKLMGMSARDLSHLPRGTVIVARELKPSDTAQLDRDNVVAFVTDLGGATSHTAILANAMGLVAVVGSGDASAKISDGDSVIVDGTNGTVIANPNPATLAEYSSRLAELHKERARLRKLAGTECVTSAGKRVIVAANIGSLRDIDAALENGADGIGLFRTEFLYLDRSKAPDEEEQYAIYKTVLEKMGGKPVIARTLDIGGDKDVPYLSLPREENPFLGLRALRLCFARPEILKTQLRALLRAAAHGNLEIMFPMIQSVAEIERAKGILAECANELKLEGKAFRDNIRVGIMIEIPAAAIMSDELAKHCDFFSVGTNDLTQYTLAADRGNEMVANLYDPFHPAVLKLIKMTIEAAHANGIPCGMCGEFAGNAKAIPTLAEYGLDEFSMSASLIPSAKDIILNLERAAEGIAHAAV